MRGLFFWLVAATPSSAEVASVSHPRADGAKASCSYWLENIKHQGRAAFNPDPSGFQVFRNVKDFGAKGDGKTDDTAAINLAISSDNTCTPGRCVSTTTAQALVYFPAGTYMISSNIVQYQGVSLHGNPNCMPVIRASSNFENGNGKTGLIEGNPNNPSTGRPYALAQNIFHRQLRNLVIDTTLFPAKSSITGIHWPTAQATSMHNVIFNMPISEGVKHTGLNVDAGGMVFFNDMVFNGGLNGFSLHISQVVMRNLTFDKCVNGIVFDQVWSMASSQMHFNDCETGIQNTGGKGTITMIDSSMKNVKVGIASDFGAKDAPPASNSVILENLEAENVPVIVKNAGDTDDLIGPSGKRTIRGLGQGNKFVGSTSGKITGSITPIKRPVGLRAPGSDKWYARSKPGYNSLPLSSFIGARSLGAKGDGESDDTAALQAAILTSAKDSKVLFLDQGSYQVTKTLYIPSNTKIVGEALPNIFATGKHFADLNNPQPLLQVGKPSERGSIEFSDFILGTQGSAPGAVLIEHNLASSVESVGGYWDVHTRIGGWTGSKQSVADCPTRPKDTKPPVKSDCIAAFMSMHITKSASGVYMENCWLWTADHDIDDAKVTQIEVYAGRGLLVESEAGNNWFVCSATEHHAKYQYNMVNTQNVYIDQVQTETPYYQPNPGASSVFPSNSSLHDPAYPNSASGTAPTNMAWGQHIANSHDFSIYGSAYFSWYINWNHDCASSATCQESAFLIDKKSTDINIYMFTVGNARHLVSRDGVGLVPYESAQGRPNSIAMFKQ